MGKWKHPLRKMKDDLRADFARYMEFHGATGPADFKRRLSVLLSSRGFWVVANYRFGRWANADFNSPLRKPIKLVLKTIYFLGRYLSVCIAKIEISIQADIGPGLFLSNKGNIMLGADRIGDHCTVHHNVTLGQDRKREEPVLGEHVWIGCDTIIYGGIEIGSHTIVENNSVLSKSLPGRMLVGGNPCKIIQKSIGLGPYSIKNHSWVEKSDNAD